MNLKTFILSLLAILIMTSCEKMIDVDQPDIIEQDQAFAEENSIRLSLLGLYSLMADLVEPMFLAGEVRADLVVATKSADPNIKEFNNNTFSASNPYVSPRPFYAVINNANDFLNEFTIMLENQEMDSTEYDKYKAELEAIRVWTQYQIAKIFGSCKYYTSVLDTEESKNIPEYAHKKTLLNILIEDLAFADTTKFTQRARGVVWQTARFSDYYVDALLGELYMDLGDYENAIIKFKEVLAVNGRFNTALKFDRGWEWFEEFFYDDWETSLFMTHAVGVIGFDSRYNQTSELRNWTQSLNYQVAPAPSFAEKFSTHAYSDEENYNIDWRILSIENYYSDVSSEYTINKYLLNDKPFILTRTARISLLLAICYNSINGEEKKAKDELKKLRKRMDYPTIDYTDEPTGWLDSRIYLEDIIMQELAYENAFEGQRWFDLMLIAKKRDDPSYLANKVAEKYPEDIREGIRKKLRFKSNWYVPVYE